LWQSRFFSGDLSEFPEEISELFVKCFSQLSVQTPIFASLLALIHAQTPDFTAVVARKLQARYLQAVSSDAVPTAKLLLRAVACLAACGSFALEGQGGLVEVLQSLLDIVTRGSPFAVRCSLFPALLVCAIPFPSDVNLFLCVSLSILQISPHRTTAWTSAATAASV
jgi:hypothetical protein